MTDIAFALVLNLHQQALLSDVLSQEMGIGHRWPRP